MWNDIKDKVPSKTPSEFNEISLGFISDLAVRSLDSNLIDCITHSQRRSSEDVSTCTGTTGENNNDGMLSADQKIGQI